MDTLRELVERSATPPSRPLDLDTVRMRAGQLRRRRHLGTAGTTVLLAAAASFMIMRAPFAVPVQPEILGGTDLATTLDDPARGVDMTEGADRLHDVDALTEPVHREPVAQEQPTAAEAPDALADPPPAGNPPTTPDDGDAAPGGPGLDEGCRVELHESPCTFVATMEGGYEADGSGDWTITIERGDVQFVVNGEVDPACGASGTIQPGDRVTVDSTRGSAPLLLSYGGHTWVGAGSTYGHGCTAT